jgi:Fe2+ or Zn2+ uptake regulation protein
MDCRERTREGVRPVVPADIGEIELEVARRLHVIGQRLTTGRRVLVQVLAAAERPLTAAGIAGADRRLPTSSVYRNLHILEAAGVVTRLASAAGDNRYELADTLAGHHHHLVCRRCGRVEDCVLPEVLERTLDEAARTMRRRHDFRVDEHRVDLLGLCAGCA